jgi:hypothetical protein
MDMRASTAIFLASSLLLTADECAWAKTKTAIAIVVLDNEGSVGVKSRVVTGDDKEILITDSQGKLEIKRACNSGEVIQANPLQTVVYYASEPINCDAKLTIKVRRRDFGDNGVVGYRSQEYLGLDGKSYSEVRIAQLNIVKRNFVDSGNVSKCIVIFDPTLKGFWAAETPSKVLVSETLGRDQVFFGDLPLETTYNGDCADSIDKIRAQSSYVAESMIGSLKSDKTLATDQLTVILSKRSGVQLTPLVGFEQEWFRKVSDLQ